MHDGNDDGDDKDDANDHDDDDAGDDENMKIINMMRTTKTRNYTKCEIRKIKCSYHVQPCCNLVV